MRFSTLFLILFILSVTHIYSQNISVKSFRILENDMDARINHSKKDQNGEKCAIIKVVTTEQGFAWEGDALGIVSIVKKTGEYWLYIPRGAKRLTLKHDQLGVLRNFVYPLPIKEATVYEMQLTTAKITTIVEEYEVPTQWVTINSEPEGADVYINEQYEGTTPFTKKMELGSHTYRLELGYYLTEAGKFELTEKERTDLNINLIPNFGYVTINSSPEQGALIDLDGIPTNNVTPYTSQQLTPGLHQVTVKKVMYNPKTVEFNIVAGETKNLNVEMESNFAMINITTTPNADIYIDEEYKGNGTYIGRLLPGLHTLEARKDKHYSDKKQQEIIVGQDVNISLHPKAKTGTIDIVTNPFNVNIKLNGKDYGTAPITLKNILIGDYILELEKEGYGTISKTINIKEDKTITINETLQKGEFISSYENTQVNNTNIKVIKVDNAVRNKKIEYKLNGGKFNQTFNVMLYVSNDGGKTFKGPMKAVSGDINKEVKSGKGLITWDAYSDKCYDKNYVYDVRAEIVTKKLERQFFIHYTGSYSLRNSTLSAPFGISFGQIGKVGWYATARLNNSAFYKSEYNYDGIDVVDYDKVLYYEYDNNYKYPSFEAFVGITKQIHWNLFLYGGIGYSYQKYFGHINEYDYLTDELKSDSYLDYTKYSISGVAGEAGFIIKAKAISFNIGVSALSFDSYSVVLGLGVNF